MSVPLCDVRRYLRHALAFADTARAAIRAAVRDGFIATAKPDGSVVTDIDRRVEDLLRDQILAEFPGHGVVGEEGGASRPRADTIWWLDPIDGTSNLVAGIPTYGTIIALHVGGKPVVGVIDHPALNMRSWAGRGLGLHRSCRWQWPTPAAGDVPLVLNDRSVFDRSGDAAIFAALTDAHPRARIYNDCFGHTLALGGGVVVVEFNARPWDLAATRLLVEEGGGIYVDSVSHRSTESSPVQGRYAVFGPPGAVAVIHATLLAFTQKEATGR